MRIKISSFTILKGKFSVNKYKTHLVPGTALISVCSSALAPCKKVRRQYAMSTSSSTGDPATSLEGKICLVTGGASGYGKALVQRLVGHGARIVCVDLNADAGQSFVRELNQADGNASGKKRAVFLQADVVSQLHMERVFERAIEEFGRIDVVVNNAGIVRKCSFVDDKIMAWRDVIDVDLTAVILGTQLALQHMIKAGHGGTILNVSSMSGYFPFPGDPVYSGAKAGVLGFTEALASFAESHGVHLNAVAPHFSDTPLTRGGFGKGFSSIEASFKLVTVESVVDAMMQCITDKSLSGDVLMILPKGIVKARRRRPKL